MTPTDADHLAERFEENRGRLRAVAFRMLGSTGQADDAVQETWLRLSRADASAIENLPAWLTTVTGRVCLDLLRSRSARREDSIDEPSVEPVASREGGSDPEAQVVMADAVGMALLTVLDTLEPAERVAYVLHDLFDVPFDEIAPVLDRTEPATRKLASRARQRMQSIGAVRRPDGSRQREIVTAFLAASRNGDFTALLALLDPNAVLRADATVVQFGAQAEVRGASEVATSFSGRAKAAQLALIDGQPGLVWMSGGAARVVFLFTLGDDAVTAIDLIADADHLSRLSITLVN